MERWDAYDGEFNIIPGKTLIRGEGVPEGVFHLVCDVLVRHSDGTYLLMQRALSKRRGGMWEASAGGAAVQGERPIDCAARELWEETGIEAEKLTELGKIVDRRKRTIYALYLCETDWDKDCIILQEGETQAYKWISGAEILKMSATELVTERMQLFVEFGEE